MSPRASIDDLRRLALAVLIALTAVGCRRDAPTVVSVEYVEVGDAGYAQKSDEPIFVVTLDRSVRREELPTSIALQTSPPIPLQTVLLDFEGDTVRQLLFRIDYGQSGVETAGIFRAPGEAGPMGLGVDLGSGVQWVDIQPRRTHPGLNRVVWDDVNGDRIVSQGDRLRLLFSRPVAIDQSPEAQVVRVPEDVLLRSSDHRLDDGRVPSRFLPSEQPTEVSIELGSAPRLFPARAEAISYADEEESLDAASALSLNGTPSQPLERIVDLKSGLGAVSSRERTIELPREYPAIHPLEDAFGDSPTPPVGPTVSPVYGMGSVAGVLVCGGLEEAPGGAELLARSKVHFFNPAARRGQRVLSVGELGDARYYHTATTLPGADGRLATADDVVFVAGGMDGVRSLGTIETIRWDAQEGRFEIETLRHALRFPRYAHTATFLPPDRILFAGGLDQDGAEIVGVAEIVQVGFDPSGRVWVPERENARVEIDLLPRMQHTASRLGRAALDSGDAWCVLLYGGLGRDPSSLAGRDTLQRSSLRQNDAAILAAPELLFVDTARLGAGAPAAETWRIVRPELPFDYAQLRYEHQSAVLSSEDTAAGTRRVFISGGSLRPPANELDARHRGRERWQFPSVTGDPALVTNLKDLHMPPRMNECANPLVIEWDASAPQAIRLRTLSSPRGVVRVHHALVALEGFGVLTIGGEGPRPDDEPIADAELYLPDRDAVAPLPLAFASPRSRFAACVLSWQGASSIYFFGGTTTPQALPTLPAVEELRLE